MKNYNEKFYNTIEPQGGAQKVLLYSQILHEINNNKLVILILIYWNTIRKVR